VSGSEKTFYNIFFWDGLLIKFLYYLFILMEIPIHIHGEYAYPVRVNVTPEQHRHLIQYKWYKIKGIPIARGVGNLYDFISDNFQNENLFADDDTLLPIHKNYTIVAFALIDPEYKPDMMKQTWILSASGYAQTTQRVALHRWLMDFPDGLVVDHINWDRLDNRIENLRCVTQAENTRNAPGGWFFGRRL